MSKNILLSLSVQVHVSADDLAEWADGEATAIADARRLLAAEVAAVVAGIPTVRDFWEGAVGVDVTYPGQTAELRQSAAYVDARRRYLEAVEGK